MGRQQALEPPVIDLEGMETQGLCNTAPGVDVYYAIFGTGATKVFLLMGIATSGLAWKNQIDYLLQFPQYQVCIMDNRGCGQSRAPPGRMTTAQMAHDVVVLLKHLGWDKYKIHLVGNSLGGMIAQEVALVIPKQIATLTLIATHSGGLRAYIPPISATLSISRQLFAKGENEQARIIMETVFSKAHLNKPGKKEYLSIINGEYPTVKDFYIESFVKRFQNVFVRENATYRMAQQFSAVLTHYISNKRLASLRDQFPTLVIVGTGDKIVHPSNSYHLVKTLKAELLEFPGAGHAVTEECLDKVNPALLDHFRRSNTTEA